MADDEIPEPDRLDGAPHPRMAERLFGQEAAEAAFLDAYTSGRLHHAWLLTGPRGIGKATLAWRIARFLLATPEEEGGLFGAPPAPETLDIAPDHPVAARLRALSEGRLALVRRGADPKSGKLRTQLTVDEIRKLKSFFQLSAAEGGRRVAIIDSADEMNPSAANALLKILEEPPPKTTILLISHQPMGLLPTIRSRCRTLRLAPLGDADMGRVLESLGQNAEAAAGLTPLSGGSAGDALRILENDGLAIYHDLVTLLGSLPRLDRRAAIAFADQAAGRSAEQRTDMIFALTEILLARLCRAGALGATGPEAAPGEAALFARLAPDAAAARRWAELAESLSARVRHGRAVNLDPAALVLDMLLKIAATA